MKDYTTKRKRSSQSLILKKRVDTQKSGLKLALAWIVMILVALFFVQQRISYIQTEKSVRNLLEEKEALQTEILPLKLEERFLTQYQRVESIAVEKLNLQLPRKEQIITYTVRKNVDKIGQKKETRVSEQE